MTSIRAATKGLLAAAALAWSGAASAQTVLDLPLDEARVLGAEAVLAGDPGLAREIATALLQGDPEDRQALILLAASELALGRPAQGRVAAAEAWRLSETPLQRYEAARLAGAAAAAQGRYLDAELWLRRALTVAPSEEEAAQTRSDAGLVRDRSPWRIDVELFLAPSDNVNGGSESPFNVVDGLPFVGVISVDGRALSGWTGGADVEVTRRLQESARQRTELSFRVGGRAVALSGEARDMIDEALGEDDPELTGGDFSSAFAQVGVQHDRLLGRALVGGGLTFGTTWYGGEIYHYSLRASGNAGLAVGDGQILRFSGFAEQRWDEGGEAGDQRVGLEAGWGRRVLGRDWVSVALSGASTLSDNGNAASTSWGVRGSYALGRSLGPARLSLTLAAEVTDYPDYAVFFPVPGGREDERLSATIEAVLGDWDYAGFEPVVTLEAARTDSNVSRFESEGVNIGFALRSSF